MPLSCPLRPPGGRQIDRRRKDGRILGGAGQTLADRFFRAFHYRKHRILPDTPSARNRDDPVKTIAPHASGQNPAMPDSPYPPAEESLERLQRSGWSMGVAIFVGPIGATVWRVDGSNGENQLRVVGITPAEAGHSAVLAASACGMLAGWPRPETGSSGARTDAGTRPGAE
jgi:hypothetical protein